MNIKCLLFTLMAQCIAVMLILGIYPGISNSAEKKIYCYRVVLDQSRDDRLQVVYGASYLNETELMQQLKDDKKYLILESPFLLDKRGQKIFLKNRYQMIEGRMFINPSKIIAIFPVALR